MGKYTRSGVAFIAATATLGLVAPMASAATTPYQDERDEMVVQHDDYTNTEHLFRVAGPSRINTAIRLMNSSEKEWVKGWGRHRTKTVIIARDDDFADALSSGPLADVLNAPVLLSAPGSSIDPRTVAAIQEKDFDEVILVGGTGVFTEGARAQLRGLGFDVTRVRGVDRYETAVNIAEETADRLEGEGVNMNNVNVYLATGFDFPDALAAGAAAADNDGIVLLTKGTELERFTYEALVGQSDTLRDRWNHIEIHTVGGQAETAARNSIEDIADTNTGANRYATAAMLASKFKNKIDKIAVTSGENYPDGVVAGAWVANHDGPLLLTRNAALSPETRAFLGQEHIADGEADIVVVGGTGSVSQNVSDQLAAMMTW